MCEIGNVITLCLESNYMLSDASSGQSEVKQEQELKLNYLSEYIDMLLHSLDFRSDIRQCSIFLYNSSINIVSVGTTWSVTQIFNWLVHHLEWLNCLPLGFMFWGEFYSKIHWSWCVLKLPVQLPQQPWTRFLNIKRSIFEWKIEFISHYGQIASMITSGWNGRGDSSYSIFRHPSIHQLHPFILVANPLFCLHEPASFSLVWSEPRRQGLRKVSEISHVQKKTQCSCLYARVCFSLYEGKWFLLTCIKKCTITNISWSRLSLEGPPTNPTNPVCFPAFF